MTIEIVGYEAAHIPAVREFNGRLHAAGVTEAFGMRSLLRESNIGSAWAPGSSIHEESFLAVDGDAVRGGYTLKHEDFSINGVVTSIGFFRQALSEGTIDKRYALIGPRLLRHALRVQPLIYGLGIGGYDRAIARLLQGAQFEFTTVPFYFRVEHPARFLRQVGPLRASRPRRLAADVGAASGLGGLGIRGLQRYRAGMPHRGPNARANDMSSFGEWADALWAGVQGTFAFGAVRDRALLAQLYDSPGNPVLKVTIEDEGKICGWAICLATQHSDDKYFGDLKLGSIVDLLASPNYEAALIQAAVDRLRREGVDLIVTNQTFRPLGAALRKNGFLSGPSNFLFAASSALAERLRPLDVNLPTFYLNRGDGDGPVNL